ncbi:MAG: AGE family epimerase/isomerase [Maricaulaceae bacterium]
MQSSFTPYYDTYAQWMVRSLKLWAKQGRDAHGGWYEHLNKNGTPDIHANRRHRIQARQVYCYTTAHEMGWFDGLEIAKTSFEFMFLQGWQGTHFIHRMNDTYKITDGRCDLYDHAFYMLSAASLFKQTDDDQYRLWIDKIIKAIDELKHPKGGWHEDELGTLPRRQNPHMHLFEAHLYLFEATGDTRFLKRAKVSLSLFKDHFYSKDTQGIIEFFGQDWSQLSGQKGDSLEPGHAAEWIWLLGWHDRLTGDNHAHLREMIFDTLARQARPYLIDETRAPDHHPVRTTRRLWVQTEWIKAHIALALDGYTPAKVMLPDLLDHFMKDYLTPNGLWHDQFDETGQDIAATIPVSNMYHIVAMICELKRLA